jgi:hypothetical protein
MQEVYGFPGRDMPDDVDFYNLSNEDIGFTATLVSATNDVYSFALPYPASIDLFDETIKVHAIEFILNEPKRATLAIFKGLSVFLSMLDREFGATFVGTGADAEDENLKAHFASFIYFGHARAPIQATAAVEGVERHNDAVSDAIYFPPIDLDLVTPLYIQFINQSVTPALATNIPTPTDFAIFEQVQLRVWFTRRKLTSQEKSARAMQINWQRLDS